MEHNDPLIPITSLIKRHLSSALGNTLLELGDGEARFNLAERMKEQGWAAIELGRSAAQTSMHARAENYRAELLTRPPSLASVVVARLSFSPTLDVDDLRAGAWNHGGPDQAELTDLCAAQHLPDPMVFPIRRALKPYGIFIHTTRAEEAGTSAEIPEEIMRRSGFMIDDRLVEMFEGAKLNTTVYRAIPRLDFGRGYLQGIDEMPLHIPYEELLHKVLSGEMGLHANRDENFTLWHVQEPTGSLR